MIKRIIVLLIALASISQLQAAVIANYDILGAPGNYYKYPDWQTGEWIRETAGGTAPATFDDSGRLTLYVTNTREGESLTWDTNTLYEFNQVAYSELYFDGDWDASTGVLSNVNLSSIVTSCENITGPADCDDYWNINSIFYASDYPDLIAVNDISLHFQPGLPTEQNNYDPNTYSIIDILIYDEFYGGLSNEDNENNFALSNYQAVSSVPVPATAWLFGSALIGLAGIKRRK